MRNIWRNRAPESIRARVASGMGNDRCVFDGPKISARADEVVFERGPFDRESRLSPIIDE